MTLEQETPPWDVLVVGQGVVGQLLSVLLAQRGHRVLAVEKQEHPYALPRAVHYTADVSRLLAGAGISREAQAEFGVPSTSYDWLNAARQLLLTFPSPVDGDQGWPDATMFTQPGMEAALVARQAELESLTVMRGTTVVDMLVHDAAGHVGATVTLESQLGQDRVSARFVVGCDGANSSVRKMAGLRTDDLGFSSDWLVMDLLVPDGTREWLPVDGQICDPERPTSAVCGGPGRRRFEFMLMPGDRREDFTTEENAWRLTQPWDLGPSDAELERLAIYTFHARCAPTWNAGPVFIAGDAAHQMPPFYGIGLVSGLRDVGNLWWKLDAVLRGSAGPQLLETYGSERREHVQYALGMSVELGRIICETDPAAVASRDAHLLEHGPLPWNAMPAMPPERLGAGFFPGGLPGNDPVAGRIGVQGRVADHHGSVVLPDSFGFGSSLLVVDASAVPPRDLATLRTQLSTGVVLLPVVNRDSATETGAASQPGVWVDVDGRYLGALRQHGAIALAYRPDFHGFGTATSPREALRLAHSLDVARAYPLPSPTTSKEASTTP